MDFMNKKLVKSLILQNEDGQSKDAQNLLKNNRYYPSEKRVAIKENRQLNRWLKLI